MAQEDFDKEMLEFEQRYNKKEKAEKNDQMRKLVIVLGAIAAALLVVLLVMWINNSKLVHDLNGEKADLTNELVELQGEYETLNTTNKAINDSLAVEKEKVGQLIERLQKTEATNRTKMRQYEKELGTLRTIMKGYIHQIDSLNTLNVALRHEASEARKAAAESKKAYEELVTTTEQYAAKASAGAVVKGRGVVLTAINASNKETDRSSRTVKLKTCLSLIENSIAERGNRTIYIKVFGPEGAQLPSDQQKAFRCGDEDMMASASRVVDYQGEEIEICIYFAKVDGAPFTKGVYRVEVFSTETKLGAADLVLR